MIDLHAHLLPAIDDGPTDVDGAVALARAAARDGVRTIIATPHVRPDYPRVVASELLARTAQLRSRLAAEGVPVRVLPGAEVDLGWAQQATDDELMLVSLGQRGGGLLVESPRGDLPAGFEEMLFGLALRGQRIVLAHPERNVGFQRSPERLRDLVERGALVQITAQALIHARRPTVERQFTSQIVREGLAHVIASDAHAATGNRAPELSTAVAAAAALVGVERAHWMVTAAPGAIVLGTPLGKPPPIVQRLRFRRAAAAVGLSR